MWIEHLELVDFRSYRHVQVDFSPRLTAILGDNGQGKTNILEAIAYLATLSSFRGAPTEALIRDSAQTAVVRGEIDQEGRSVLIEAEIPRTGRARVQVNRQRLGRSRDLLGALRVTVFAPDDLSLVKGGPAERRRYLDDLLVSIHVRNDGLQRDLERVLRQRNTLLRQAGGRLTPEIETTLDVWDDKLVALGEKLADGREQLVAILEPVLGEAYDRVARFRAEIGLRYDAPWRSTGLREALAEVRRDELRRGVTLVGPHRDDLVVTLGGRSARTHASQGEQRSLALALRLAAHAVVTDATGSGPILLLDDVFSELDPQRSAALLESLPDCQTILTTAGGLPHAAHPDVVVVVSDGSITVEALIDPVAEQVVEPTMESRVESPVESPVDRQV